MDMYLLDKNGAPVPCEDAREFATWFENADRRLCYDDISEDICVSTVFLGFDHGWTPGAPPILWETMVFGGQMNGEQERYTTRDQAIVGHWQMVRDVERALQDAEVKE